MAVCHGESFYYLTDSDLSVIGLPILMKTDPLTPVSNELEIKSILLLDDDIELADTLKELLDRRNYLVTTVKNGVEGLREIMAFDFDVILCDIKMPAMAGDMFFLAVQKTKPELANRVIFVTAYANDPEIEKFTIETGRPTLVKPVQIEDLVQAIGMVLQETQNLEKTEL